MSAAPTMVKAFTHKSAKLRIVSVAGSAYGVLEARFSGVLDEQSFGRLRAVMEAETERALGVVIRLEDVVTMFKGRPPLPKVPRELARAALVAPVADYSHWRDYSARLSKAGGTGLVVFSDGQLEHAYWFAEMSASHSARDAAPNRGDGATLMAAARRAKEMAEAAMARMVSA